MENKKIYTVSEATTLIAEAIEKMDELYTNLAKASDIIRTREDSEKHLAEVLEPAFKNITKVITDEMMTSIAANLSEGKGLI